MVPSPPLYDGKYQSKFNPYVSEECDIGTELRDVARPSNRHERNNGRVRA